MYAISRSSVHGIEILFNLFYPERPVKGQRMGNGTLFSIGSDDKNISNLLESFCQDNNAFGMDAIIVGNQDYQSVTHDSFEKDLGNQCTAFGSHLPSQTFRIKISEKICKIKMKVFTQIPI
jgi:hypothetical protein